MPLLEVKNLSVNIRTPAGKVQAVRAADFTVGRNEVLAIVGESGSGKTVTAQTLMRLNWGLPFTVTKGAVFFDGERTLPAPGTGQGPRGRKIAMIFQDPVSALNPTMPVGAQIAEVFTRHFRLQRRAARARTLEILARVGLEPETCYRRYPHQLSGGMCQRVMVAMALAAEPNLLIADEPTSSLDVTVQARVLGLIDAVRRRRRMSLILITHDLSIAANIADRVAVMYAGTVVETGSVRELFHRPRHPYTQGLLAALPRLNGNPEELRVIPGDPPDMMHPPPGCPFRPRCPHAVDICGRTLPPRVRLSDTHSVRCRLTLETSHNDALFVESYP